LWAAGGLADETRARAALGAGAAGIVMGTRYLATHEADAHRVWQGVSLIDRIEVAGALAERIGFALTAPHA